MSPQQVQGREQALPVLQQETEKETVKDTDDETRLAPVAGKTGRSSRRVTRQGGRTAVASRSFRKRFPVIRRVLEQEKALFAGQKVSDRIVSVDKPHLRPIVRGKETKTVEFGAKVNNIQVDGISFIEHLSFNAFNEGTRLQTSIALQERLLNTRVSPWRPTRFTPRTPTGSFARKIKSTPLS